jgi:enterochelin esterase-like enzyme
MKFRLSLIILIFISNLFACTTALQKQIPTDCTETGIIGTEQVPNPSQGFDISFHYYLPPCYKDLNSSHFPVLYLLSVPTEQQLEPSADTPMSLADRLIRKRRMAPAILIVPEDTIGYGYHAALVRDLIPYVDKKFNTLTDRQYRGVGGISHGAAIAARMAFQFSDLFGSLGIFSGGIDVSEKATFAAWIASSNNPPRVLINVGDQDGIMPLTRNLLDVFDSQDIPYKLKIEAGGHTWEFWSAHMESYLLWFADAWE